MPAFLATHWNTHNRSHADSGVNSTTSVPVWSLGHWPSPNRGQYILQRRPKRWNGSYCDAWTLTPRPQPLRHLHTDRRHIPSLLTYTFLSLLTDTFGRPELKKNQYSRGAVNDGTHSPLSFALAGPERARHALNGHRGQHQRQSASTLGSSRFFDLVAQGTLMHTLSHMHSTHLLALMHNIRRCANLSNRLEYHCSGKCRFY